MQDIFKAIEHRRTIRNYDPNFQIPKEQLEKIIEAARMSPTGEDAQGYDFIVVTNKEKLKGIEKAVLDGLNEGWRKAFEGRREKHHVDNVVTCDASTVVLLVRNERENKSWIKYDSGICMMSIMMAAQYYGYESMCLGVVSNEMPGDIGKNVEKLFNLKEGSLLIGICFGKATPDAKCPKRELKEKITYV